MSSTAPQGLVGRKGDGLLVLWGDIDPTKTDEADLNDWWTNEHLPERLRLPGFLRAHRYRGLEPREGKNEYLACYEVSKVEDLASEEYMSALNNPTPKTKKFMPCLAGMNRSGCFVVASRDSDIVHREFSKDAGDYLVLLVFDPPGQELKDSTSVQDFIGDTLQKTLDTTIKDWTSLHIVRLDDGVTKAGSTSRSYDGVKFSASVESSQEGASQRHIVLLTLTADPPTASIPPIEKVQTALTSLVKELQQFGAVTVYQGAFEFVCSMDKSTLD